MDAYPYGPGYKVEGTSREAAESVNLWRSTLWVPLLRALQKEPGTCQEVGRALGASYHVIHPRMSELRAMGFVEPSGVRRLNVSGRSAIVWRVVREKMPEGLSWQEQKELFS